MLRCRAILESMCTMIILVFLFFDTASEITRDESRGECRNKKGIGECRNEGRGKCRNKGR